MDLYLKMGDMDFNCPVCCNKTFSSRQLLIEHLANIIESLYCPVCNYKSSTLQQLVDHLALDNCIPNNAVETIVLGNTQETNIENTDLATSTVIKNNNEIETHIIDHTFSPIETMSKSIDETGDFNNVYEFLNKQLMKNCLQSQELKLIKQDGTNEYMLVTQDETVLNDDTIVTKQNNDGTISLTTVKDMKIESEPRLSPTRFEQEQNTTEVYSCNTCGVSFTSIIEHIQNYHSDQDVVVEEPLENMDSGTLEYTTNESIKMEIPPLIEKQAPAPRRVITDTGDIVEAPVDKVPEQVQAPVTRKKGVTEKPPRSQVKRYKQVDKLCQSVVKDIKETDTKDGPYHKVTVSEVQTETGFLKMYKCLSCSVYVSDLEDFKLHPCKVLKYICPHCPVAYDNSKSLCAHMKVHRPTKEEALTATPQENKKYECEVCSTVFLTNKSLKLHRRMHDPIKTRLIEPPEETQSGDTKYRCNICDKIIPLAYKTLHQNSHKTSDKMNCTICNKKFTSMEYLEMHMGVHVDKVPANNSDKTLPYKCLYCNRRFARPHEKVKHERIHTGEKPHYCEICGKSFRVSYCLTLHMRTHTGARPYSCHHCGKRFKAHSVYNHHLLTHSDVRAYKCPYCPKAFKTAVQLGGHKNSHTKPFSCQQCNRPFASLYAVRVHTETHARHNNLKFSCSLCGASYARAFALKDHVRQAHNQDLPADQPDHATGKQNRCGKFLKDKGNVWLLKDNADSESMDSLNKDIVSEISPLDSNEYIVPT